jgi:hypothetical protein
MSNKLDTYSAMQTDDPFKVYKKTTLGKVYLEVIDPFEDKPIGIILQGNPNKNEDGCFVKVWNERQNQFLVNRNQSHFEAGRLIEWDLEKLKKAKQKKKEKSYSEYSDEDIEEIVNSEFFKFKSALNKADSEAFVYRLLSKAEELEKSKKIIDRIEARLHELQIKDMVPDGDTE